MESGISISAAVAAKPAPTTAEVQNVYAQQLAKVPEFATYGEVFKSSANPVELTESEMEYVVRCIKHIFAEHIVFQVSLGSPLSFHSRN